MGKPIVDTDLVFLTAALKDRFQSKPYRLKFSNLP